MLFDLSLPRVFFIVAIKNDALLSKVFQMLMNNPTGEHYAVLIGCY